MDGFKLGVFYSEARINRSTGELLLYDWSNTKSRLDPGSFLKNFLCLEVAINCGAHQEGRNKRLAIASSRDYAAAPTTAEPEARC